MGEAKRRGDVSQRIQQAVARAEVRIDSIKAEFGLPDSSKFLGCVVVLPESDEYLVFFKETPDMLQKGFAPTPENAIIFKTREEADSIAGKLTKNNAISGLLFDAGDQYFVTFDNYKK